MYYYPQYSYPQTRLTYSQQQAEHAASNTETNKFWENWGSFGKIFGIPLIFFGIFISVFEIFRVLYGPLHRGISNLIYNSSRVFCI